MENRSIRPLMLLGFIASLAMIGTALFFQYVLYYEPCPLCSVQRGVVIIFAIIFLVAFSHGPLSISAKRFYGFLLTLTSIAGLVVAGRHTWLQHLPPDKIPECGPGLDFWMNNLPAVDVIQKIFQGSGECAAVVWSFLSLSIPEWSLIAFAIFMFFSLRLLFIAR